MIIISEDQVKELRKLLESSAFLGVFSSVNKRRERQKACFSTKPMIENHHTFALACAHNSLTYSYR